MGRQAKDGGQGVIKRSLKACLETFNSLLNCRLFFGNYFYYNFLFFIPFSLLVLRIADQDTIYLYFS